MQNMDVRRVLGSNEYLRFFRTAKVDRDRIVLTSLAVACRC